MRGIVKIGWSCRIGFRFPMFVSLHWARKMTVVLCTKYNIDIDMDGTCCNILRSYRS